MSISNFLQNSRCMCNVQLTKQKDFQLLLRRYSSTETKEIVIPKRIPRGPTDILKALASTIKRDPTAPHYKYHDDPYLIPVSNIAKRTFALSQESGRKAAMWVKSQHPELFQHIEADPPIQSYLAKPIYDEFDDVDESLLLKTMRTTSVNDSVQIYELLLKTQTPVSDDAKLCLLELICFFNGEEQLSEELIEERWFSQSVYERHVLKKTWKDDGYADKLFSELPPSPRSYSAIIMGMVKYFQLEKANEYYRNAVAQNFALSPDTYSAMIKMTNFLKEGWEERWKFIEGILSDMNEQGCKPTVQTLNRVLDIFARNPSVPSLRSLALQMIAEVKRFGIEPSLGTYHLLLNIFCRTGRPDRNPSYILEDILAIVEGKEFTVQDITDTLFFSTAMEKCRFYYNNSDLAFRVNRLLWHGKNYNLIGNSFRESVYYRNFFLTLCQNETLETIMEQYNHYVPNIYSPEMSVMNEIINVVTMNGAVHLYPKLWSDIVLLEMTDKSDVVSNLLKGMLLNQPPPSTPPVEMAVSLASTAYSIYSKTEKDYESNKNIVLEWTGDILGDIVHICLLADDFDKAKDVFNKIIRSQNTIVGSPTPETIEALIDACIKHNDAKLAVMVTEYCHDRAYMDDKQYAKKLIQGMYLSPMYQAHLGAIFGQSIFKENPKETQAIEA